MPVDVIILKRLFTPSPLVDITHFQDAYFLVQQQALEDFSAEQDKANQLAKLIASHLICALVANFDAQWM